MKHQHMEVGGLKLHGLNISNYNNVAKLALLEKGLSFEEVQVMPNKESAFLDISPMGKIPVLEDESHFIAETWAILRYLELKYPQPALFPTEPLAAARAQQIHATIDFYVDAAARTLLNAAFFGGEASPEKIEDVSQKLARAAEALGKLVAFDPFIAGDSLTHADMSAVNTLPLATQIMTNVGAKDPFADIAGLKAYFDMMGQRPTVQKVMTDRNTALAALGRG